MKHTFSTLGKGEVDKDKGIIYAVSLIEMGIAKGHNLIIDMVTLQQVAEKSKVYDNGLKVKLNHGSGVDAICGRIDNIRVLGQKVVGDLHLLRFHPHFGLILEMAETQPDTFGMSVAFQGTPEPTATGLVARVDEIFSCDLVCEPAATEALFEAKELCDDKKRQKEGKAGKDEEYMGKLSAMLDRIEVGLETAFSKNKWTKRGGGFMGLPKNWRKNENRAMRKVLKKQGWSDKKAKEWLKPNSRSNENIQKERHGRAIRRAISDNSTSRTSIGNFDPNAGHSEKHIQNIIKRTWKEKQKKKAGKSGKSGGGDCGTGAGGFQPSNTCASN